MNSEITSGTTQVHEFQDPQLRTLCPTAGIVAFVQMAKKEKHLQQEVSMKHGIVEYLSVYRWRFLSLTHCPNGTEVEIQFHGPNVWQQDLWITVNHPFTILSTDIA